MCEKKQFDQIMRQLPEHESPRSAIMEEKLAQLALYAIPTVLVGLLVIEHIVSSS